MALTQYDESIIQKFADDLYSRARTLIIVQMLKWGLASALLVWLLVWFSAPRKFAGPPPDGGFPFFVGVVISAFAGVAARDKAFLLRLEAQKLLVQVQIQRNTQKESSMSRSSGA